MRARLRVGSATEVKGVRGVDTDGRNHKDQGGGGHARGNNALRPSHHAKKEARPVQAVLVGGSYCDEVRGPGLTSWLRTQPFHYFDDQ